MPYHLEPAGKDRFYVVSTKTGMRHSLKPLSKPRAEAQMRALYNAMRMRGEYA
jgi:hypothetical protein